MKITELVNKPHVFTLKNGKTLRIYASETIRVSKSVISHEVELAEKMGLILIQKDSAEETRKIKL